MSKKALIYVGFFVALFGGYFIYLFANHDFTKSSLPVINDNVPAFSFTNQDGKEITERNIDGKVYVAEYFFTTCKGICPRMNANMRKVFDAYKDEKGFAILSHTCMPETDFVPLLKAYEAKMLNGVGAHAAEWDFVTGDKTALYNMARHGYVIDNNKPDSLQNISDQFIHTQFFALMDKQRRVRGVYDGLKEDEIQKLLKDIKGLLNEKYQTRSLKGF